MTALTIALLASLGAAFEKVQQVITAAAAATDETDTIGQCPDCGAEIQRQDSTLVKSKVQIFKGPNYTTAYRCPNAPLGRDRSLYGERCTAGTVYDKTGVLAETEVEEV